MKRKYLILIIITLAVILFALCLTIVHLGEERATAPGGFETATGQSGGSASPSEAAAPTAAPTPLPTATPISDKKIVVLDAGHGKSSSSMTEAEKISEGYVYNQSKGGWGEWRHWKSGTTYAECEGSGCSGRAPSNGGCWYPIGNGDRSTEPELNLSNTLAAKAYLEEMGYEVRLTRSTNDENPSMSKRLSYCYPSQDTSLTPDADIYVCIHSNAGGGRGSAYMSLSGEYDQDGVLPSDEYVYESNKLGSIINSEIVSETSLSAFAGGNYQGLPEAILFCKSPIPIAYLEIGFFDSADLSILREESDLIGRAIASGIDEYFEGSGDYGSTYDGVTD